MADTKHLTVRVKAELHEALRVLGSATKSTMNRMIVEAIESYVSVQGRAIEQDLEATLERLRALREKDPDHVEAIRRFATAEGKHEDPIDTRVTTELPKAQSEMRRLLGST